MSFSGDVSNFVSKTKVDTTKKFQAVSLELFRRVIMKTPVDTGRARANWQFSLNEPKAIASDATDKSGQTTVNDVASQLAKVELGSTVWLSNNLPYIRPLEYGEYPNPAKHGVKTAGGFSIQAPQGMVRVTAAEFGTLVQR